VTVDALDGRTLTVAGAGLAGKGANHFAEGWIEVGSGESMEVRTILQSAAESGGKVTLTLNAPLAWRKSARGDPVPRLRRSRCHLRLEVRQLCQLGRAPRPAQEPDAQGHGDQAGAGGKK
jgi:hypothetical protein